MESTLVWCERLASLEAGDASLGRSLGGLAGDGEEEFELGRQLVFGVESVGEVDSSDAAVRVDLNSKINNLGYASIRKSQELQNACSLLRAGRLISTLTYLRVSI